MNSCQIHRLWNGITPILTINLVDAGIVDASFNEVLTYVAVKAFDEFTGAYPSVTRNSDGKRRRRRITENQKHINFGSPLSSGNNMFFEYQRTHGFRLAIPSISDCPCVQKLEDEIFVNASIHYLKHAVDATLIADQLASASGEFSIDLWAAIQRGKGAYHAFHVHEGAVLSGVYYSACPVGCAPLVLRKSTDEGRTNECIKETIEDDVIIEPREGDLILFPPWTMHGVTASHSVDKPRVSWPFNLNARLANIGNSWDITR